MNVVNLEKPSELQKTLAAYKSQLTIMIEYAQETAKLRKASYDALIKEGFTREEALELCKSSLNL